MGTGCQQLAPCPPPCHCFAWPPTPTRQRHAAIYPASFTNKRKDRMQSLRTPARQRRGSGVDARRREGGRLGGRSSSGRWIADAAHKPSRHRKPTPGRTIPTGASRTLRSHTADPRCQFRSTPRATPQRLHPPGRPLLADQPSLHRLHCLVVQNTQDRRTRRPHIEVPWALHAAGWCAPLKAAPQRLGGARCGCNPCGGRNG